MIKTKPIHQRINWPDDFNLRAVALGIYRCLYGYLDLACFPVEPTRKHYESHRLANSNATRDRQAAMWYAVMRTALETYGIKMSVQNGCPRIIDNFGIAAQQFHNTIGFMQENDWIAEMSKRQIIIDTLLEYQEQLSDGFGYYYGRYCNAALLDYDTNYPDNAAEDQAALGKLADVILQRIKRMDGVDE